ncbi:MAG: nicotinate (nicotinamide) nucleotide adenylyltransferase [Ruminococcus sp.]|nr:nicotinate (nicotinamide) nucleotide adenylyltransferase [Ruminococcus sp.]
MKLAMFGGSFDPVHRNHVALCETMIEKIGLDKVIVFPAACSPFKTEAQTEDFHRLNMCKIAFEHHNTVEVSDFEILRGGKSYTVDTLRFLSAEYKDAELYLITGADAFLTLDKWYKAEEIFSLAHILTVVRDDDDISILKAKAEEYKVYKAKCTLVSTLVGPISSTKVREVLKNGLDVSLYLQDNVLKYIKENGLYGYAD